MEREFAVMAETALGNPMVLRRGFATKGDAEDYPVKLSNWVRVWVEEIPSSAQPSQEPPSTPWRVRWAQNRLAYLEDSDGQCFATLLGTQKRREGTIKMLQDAGLMDDTS